MCLCAQINDYMTTFDQYSFLWKEDLQAVYGRFMSSSPTLEAFEAELKKWVGTVAAAACARAQVHVSQGSPASLEPRSACMPLTGRAAACARVTWVRACHLQG